MTKYVKYLLLILPLLMAATPQTKNRLRVIIPHSYTVEDNYLYLLEYVNEQKRIVDQIYIAKGQTEFEFNLDKYQQRGAIYAYSVRKIIPIFLSKLEPYFDVTITVYENGTSIIRGVGARRDSIDCVKSNQLYIFRKSIPDSLNKYQALGYSEKRICQLRDSLYLKFDDIIDDYHTDKLLHSEYPDEAFNSFDMLSRRRWKLNSDSIHKYDAMLKQKFPNDINIQRYPEPIIQVEPDEQTCRINDFIISEITRNSLPADISKSIEIPKNLD